MNRRGFRRKWLWYDEVLYRDFGGGHEEIHEKPLIMVGVPNSNQAPQRNKSGMLLLHQPGW